MTHPDEFSPNEPQRRTAGDRSLSLNNADNNASDFAPFGPADEWVSKQLESENSADANPNQADFASQFSSQEKRRAADLLLLQALLEVTVMTPSQHDVENRERISATPENSQSNIIHLAMRAIRESDNSPQPGQAAPAPLKNHSAFQPLRRLRTAWITALSVVIACGIWFEATNPSRQLRAAVELIRQVAAQAQDREYRVTIHMGASDDGAGPALLRKVEGDLFVRGGEAFAFRAPAFIGKGEIWFGGNAQRVWLKPAIGPIVLEGQPEALLKRWLERPIDAHFLQITTVLDRLEKHYQIDMLPDEALPNEPDEAARSYRRLKGICRSTQNSLPSSIDIWAAKNTGIVVQLILNWDSNTVPGHMQIEFKYVQQHDRTSDWYRPEGHPRERQIP